MSSIFGTHINKNKYVMERKELGTGKHIKLDLLNYKCSQCYIVRWDIGS